jgi:hypothetical protein
MLDGLDPTVSADPGNEFCIASAGVTVDLQPGVGRICAS